MHHTYEILPDDDSGKYLVIDRQTRKWCAGPFATIEQAQAWIQKQNDIQQGVDG